jgi:hypothetical protein
VNGPESRRRGRDEEDAGDRDETGHDGEGAKDPFPARPLGDEARDEVAADAAEGGSSGCRVSVCACVPVKNETHRMR